MKKPLSQHEGNSSTQGVACAASTNHRSRHFAFGKYSLYKRPIKATSSVCYSADVMVFLTKGGRYGLLLSRKFLSVSSWMFCASALCCISTTSSLVSVDAFQLTPQFQGSYGLFPSVVNLASQAHITANATCGNHGPVKYCRLVEHVDRRRFRNQQCSICDSHSSNPFKRHPIQYAIDGQGGHWWQSPTIDQGYQYHYVTINLDLKQVAYVIVKAANAPRPGNWILEKSIDGVNWFPWQYFAISDRECARLYGIRATGRGAPKYRSDSDVLCTSHFSELIPLQNGEIHVSLINGRPTAESPSEELVEFTSARYIRLRLQKIRTLYGDLMPLSGFAPSQQDPSVTRRYFYSIKDISIGGMCICYGHARNCPTDVESGHFQCACEHNTMGPNCQQCRSGYQQLKWMPGNNGFQCKACNCHGHAEECYYDQAIADRKESINLEGEYIGGGVCVECRDHTYGVNCQTCVDGYYRPFDAEPEDKNPCVRCDCDPYGGTRVAESAGSFMCVKDITFVDVENDLYPGSCYCKEGFMGRRCDRCAFGFRNYPRCDPCSCNVAGSENNNPCEGGCVCKENVEGDSCGTCTQGFFNLQRQNAKGCEVCYCSGVSRQCMSADLKWSTIHTNHNWEVRDKRGNRKVIPDFDHELREPYVENGSTARALGTAMYYWAAPDQYLGKHTTSYGGTLRYIVSYDILQGTQALPIQDADVILEGNGRTLLYNYMGSVVFPQEETEISLKLEATTNGASTGWVVANTFQRATKEDLMKTLEDVTRLLIRAVYSGNSGAIYRIRDVYMQSATKTGEGGQARSVEKCRCPEGFVGLSCETCADSYYRHGAMCLPCQCNGHSPSCDKLNGACQTCRDNTMGMHCERCKPGFYGDATEGNIGDCQRCSCPLFTPSNNFSPTCRLDRLTAEMICLQCPEGYTGKRCESCATGYFGSPTSPGGSCRPCNCNGNSNTCDKLTGMCSFCRGHTAGDHCEICEPAYYGDAIERKNCGPCQCNPVGSQSRQCHLVTGQCPCLNGVYGRKCDACQTAHYLSVEARMCVPCQCDATGSLSQQCNPDGSCACRKGVEGQRCTSCTRGYFGFSQLGCIECNCEHTNDNCDVLTGECVCPPNTRGSDCMQCVDYAYDWDAVDGCKLCNCSRQGSQSASCDTVTGQCKCEAKYAGRQCESCLPGFYGFPDCQPCRCNKAGTVSTNCSGDTCQCKRNGNCHCKKNVIGQRCDQCAPGYFGLSTQNSDGCSSCFCSGVTDSCTVAAQYFWGQPISLNSAPVEVLNLTTVAKRSRGLESRRSVVELNGNQVARSLHSEPYYWRLPPQFNGDKTLSYGGKLRYTIYYVSTIPAQYSDAPTPSVVLRGGNATKIAIQYTSDEPQTGQSRSYVVPMQENGWTHLDSNANVTRSEFASLLNNIEFFLIKASYGRLMGQSRLSDVFLDLAEYGVVGRGDAATNLPRANSIEQCFCPPGYKGLSCQNCDGGYMRVQQGPRYGKCEPCNCNNRSDTCDIWTGRCLNCDEKFTGKNCEACLPGYYLTNNACHKCACPIDNPMNNFSPTCHADGADGISSYTCDQCKMGYTGKHCDRCADGYFGDPSTPGGFCAKCGCNVAGSLDGACNKTTGQCLCDDGISGRICDQCMPRHVISQFGCEECSDECSGELLLEIEGLTGRVTNVEIHTMFPAPWNRLIAAQNLTMQLMNVLQLIVGNSSASNKKNLDKETSRLMKNYAKILSLAPTVIVLDQNVSSLQPEADVCTHSGRITSNDVRDSAVNIDKTKATVQSLSFVVEGFSRSSLRSLHQLQNSSTQEVTSMLEKFNGWVVGMRQANFSQYQSIADVELRLAESLWNRTTKGLIQPANRRYNDLLDDHAKLVANVTNLRDALSNTKTILKNTTTDIAITKMSNNLRRQTMRQTASDIQHANNEVIITDVKIKQAESAVYDASLLLENGTATFDNLPSASSNLEGVFQKLTAASNKLMPGIEVTFAKVELAKTRARELQKEVNGFMRVKKNISDFTYNQTEAATRWTNIAKTVKRANRIAEEALRESMLAFEAITTDFGEQAADSLRRIKDNKEVVSGLQITVGGDRSQLRNLDDALRSAHRSTRNFTTQYDDIQKRLANPRKRKPLTADVVINAVNNAKRTLDLLEVDLKYEQDKVEKLGQTEIDVSHRGETRKSISDNMARLSERLSLARTTSRQANEISQRVEVLSERMKANISYIRKLIEDTKMKAASIRHASVGSSGRCSMAYKPLISPSKTTEIVLNVNTNAPNNTLLYLAKPMKDYIIVQMINRRVSVTWDLGGGAGFVENPVVVNSQPNTLTPGNYDWYRIEIVRRDQGTNLTVYRSSNKKGTIRSAYNVSCGTYAMLDIDREDLLFVGGINNSTKLHSSVVTRSFTGCMGEATLQGKSVGLWNFKTIQNGDDCTGCQESPIIELNEEHSNMFSYTGHSYTLLPIPKRQTLQKSEFTLFFKTFSSEGLIVYAASKTLPDVIALELSDGHLVLKIDLGSGIYNVSTTKRYNIGEWVFVSVVRIGQRARLTTKRDGQGEDEWVTISNSDGLLNVSDGDYFCVGGVPAERTLKEGVTSISFVGCIKQLMVSNTIISLKRSRTGEVVRDSGVSATCPHKITRNIGIAKDGYVKVPGLHLPQDGSVSMSFSTLEPDAILLVGSTESKNTASKKRRRRRQAKKEFIALYLLAGKLHCDINLRGVGTLNISSKNAFYNNGSPQTFTLRRNASSLTLKMDDTRDVVSIPFPVNFTNTIMLKEVYVGGIPTGLHDKHFVPTVKSLNGCVTEVLAGVNMVNFNGAVEAKNSYIGTCAFVHFAAPVLSTPLTAIGPTIETARPRPAQLSTLLPHDFPKVIPTLMTEIKDPLCGASGRMPLFKNQSAHFGLDKHSHVQFILKKKIAKKFRFDFKVKTLGTSGLLMHAGHSSQKDYFSLLVKDGKPVFQFNNGNGVGEGVSKKRINDGKWHKIRIKRSRRKGWLYVDGKKIRFQSPPGANQMDINNVLYVGGLPAVYKNGRSGKLDFSMDACMRDLKINKKTKLNLAMPAYAYQVTRCNKFVEVGASFSGSSYAIYDDSYRVGTNMVIELKFRTWASNGILLSIFSDQSDGFALVMVNGSVYLSANNGEGMFESVYTPPTSRRIRNKFNLCNGKWHTVFAEKRKCNLTLRVDGNLGHRVTPFAGTLASADTRDPLYIGGLPATGDAARSPSSGLRTTKNFNGCLKDVTLKGEPVSFSDVWKRVGVYPNSCPTKR